MVKNIEQVSPKKETKKDNVKKMLVIFGIIFIVVLGLLLLLFIGLALSSGSGISLNSQENTVAIIPIHGIIVSESSPSLFGDTSASAKKLVEQIKKADDDSNVKAIVFDINSPGGSAVASDEIAFAIKKVNKTTVAQIGELGASGGYWIASSTDYIIANRMSITGSIGVIASYLEFPGLMEKYGVGYRRLVAGEHKDIGSPFKEMTSDEEALFQKSLDKIHNYFIQEVASNRKLREERVRELATGRIFLGVEAYEAGLVDALGSRDDVKTYLEKTLGGKVTFIEYTPKQSLFELLNEVISQRSFYVGKGIGSTLLEEGELSIKT